MVIVGLLGGGLAAVDVAQGSDSANKVKGLASAQALPLGSGPISQKILDQRTATLLAASERTSTASNTVLLEVPGGETSSNVHITYLRLSDGLRMATNSENDLMPGLSLVKLFIADYVLDHGSASDRKKIIPMIRMSSDALATELFEDYPESISQTAKKYGLNHTISGKRWGVSETSTSDVVKFLSQLKKKNPNSPILQGMKTTSLIAEDGTEQNYGTSVLPRVKGTKFGWSDDKDMHSSISFGDDFIVAAYAEGSASDLTSVVQETLGDFPADGLLPQAKSVQKNLGPKVLNSGRGGKETLEGVSPEKLLTPEVNEAFRNYFRNNSSAVQELESAWEKSKNGGSAGVGSVLKSEATTQADSAKVASTQTDSTKAETATSKASASSAKASSAASTAAATDPSQTSESR